MHLIRTDLFHIFKDDSINIVAFNPKISLPLPVSLTVSLKSICLYVELGLLRL